MAANSRTELVIGHPYIATYSIPFRLTTIAAALVGCRDGIVTRIIRYCKS